MKILMIGRAPNLSIADALPTARVVRALSGAKGLDLVRVEQPDAILITRDELAALVAKRTRQFDQSLVEQALRESEIKHRTLFESANDAILLLYAGRFIDCNTRALKMFGCTREQLVGAAPFDYSPDSQPDGQPSQEKASEKVNLALTEGPQFFEWEHYRRDGTPFMAEVSLSRLDLGEKIMLQAIVRDVTDRKRAEEALRHSQQNFQTIFEQAPLGIALIDSVSGHIYHVNRRYAEIAGRSVEEMKATDWMSITHPDDVEEDLKNMALMNAGRISGFSMDKRYIRKDGSLVWVNLTVAPVTSDNSARRCHLAMVEDITDRKKAETALQESERKYRELVEFANSIILRWTHDGRITFLNEFGQRFFGYSAEEIIGRHVMGTIVPATDTEGVDLRRLMERICADPAAFEKNVNENMRRSGERVWIAWTNKIVRDANGQIEQILSIGTDITELKRAGERIRDLNLNLEKRVVERTAELGVAKERAEAADRLKSAFLATMSHELRTPLNSIIGFTGIILQGLAGPLNPEQRKQLEMVQDSARHLLALINDVLDISKIEAGQLEVVSEGFDLRGAIAKVIGLVKPLAQKKGLDLRVEVAAEIDALASDQRRVEQVLLNLLSNAIKFTERGVVSLTAKFEGVAPHAAVHISVADTGIGIKAEDLSKLFQPFRQIDTGLSRQYEGTGLGLTICRRLADLLGGEVRAASEWGKGSIFTLVLPMKGPETI